MVDELLENLETYLDPAKEWTDAEEKQLTVLLRWAGDKVLARRFPYDPDKSEVPAQFRSHQVRIAAELFAKMGAEGQSGHSENGIGRTWETADVAKGILEEITPMAGVF